MKKKATFIRICLAALTLMLGFTACGDKPKQEGPQQSAFELSMTEKDTTVVAGLVDQFFELIEANRVTDAVSMLYQINYESKDDNVVELLDNENIARVTNLFKSFPIVSHHIDYVKFYGVYSNEVKVTATIMEATDGQPAVKTVFYFKPVDDVGQWRLCLMDSNKKDERIISNTEADSVAARYSDYKEEKSQQQAEN